MGFTRVFIKKDDESVLAAAELACSLVRQCGVQLRSYESVRDLTTDGRHREVAACAVGFYIYMSSCHPGIVCICVVYMRCACAGVYVCVKR